MISLYYLSISGQNHPNARYKFICFRSYCTLRCYFGTWGRRITDIETSVLWSAPVAPIDVSCRGRMKINSSVTSEYIWKARHRLVMDIAWSVRRWKREGTEDSWQADRIIQIRASTEPREYASTCVSLYAYIHVYILISVEDNTADRAPQKNVNGASVLYAGSDGASRLIP